MTQHQRKAIELDGKKPFIVTKSNEKKRYSINDTIEHVKARFPGKWTVKEITWDEFDSNHAIYQFNKHKPKETKPNINNKPMDPIRVLQTYKKLRDNEQDPKRKEGFSIIVTHVETLQKV